MNDPKLTPREPTEAERLADAIDPLIRARLDNLTCGCAAAELRRLQAENDALRAMHDAAPTVEESPYGWHLPSTAPHWYSPVFVVGPVHPGPYTRDEALKLGWTPVYAHPAAPQPAALPEPADKLRISRFQLVDHIKSDDDLQAYAQEYAAVENAQLREALQEVVGLFGTHAASWNESAGILNRARALIAALKGKK